MTEDQFIKSRETYYKQLVPCKYCGHEVKLYASKDMSGFFVECLNYPKCSNSPIAPTGKCSTPEEAIEKWNSMQER